MAIAVEPDGMTGGQHPLDQRGLLGRSRSDGEERRLRPVGGQQVQQSRGVATVGTVVEGEGQRLHHQNVPEPSPSPAPHAGWQAVLGQDSFRGKVGGVAIAILDIDGTLVDTNYQHVIAWSRAFHRYDIVLPLWRIHRHIGMGGDQVVTALCGEDVENALGDDIRGEEGERYMELIGEVHTMEGSRDLIVALKDRGHAVVLASSAKQDEVDAYLDLLDARSLVDGWTTSADVESTKPAPDLVHAALKLVEGRPGPALMVGDTPWDIEAAAKADVKTLAVITGGFATQELQDAGAAGVFESVAELRDRLDETPLR
jgi:HAD superfamily hydrolase (TIGR01509 family)